MEFKLYLRIFCVGRGALQTSTALVLRELQQWCDSRYCWCCCATSGHVHCMIWGHCNLWSGKNKVKFTTRREKKKTRGCTSSCLSLAEWAIHLYGMCGWKIQASESQEMPPATPVGKSSICVEEVGHKKEKRPVVGGQVGHRELRHGACSLCLLVWCIIGKAAIDARESLILLLIVCMRGLLQADSGSNEESADQQYYPHVDFAYRLWLGEITASHGDHYFWRSDLRKPPTWIHVSQ